MFKMELHWLVPSVLLSSDRLLNHEVSNITSNGLTQEELRANVYRMALRDYQINLPGRLRKEDIDLALMQWVNIRQPPDLLSVLNQLRDNFIHWRGDRFEVKHLELKSWLTLLSQIDPAWVIGVGYAEWLDKGILGVEQVIDLTRQQCPSALPQRFDSEPVADNHVHLNGNGHYSLSLASFALHLKCKPKQSKEKWPYRQEYNLMNSGVCDITQLPMMFNRLFGLLLNTMASINNSLLCSTYNWSSLVTHLATPYATQLRLTPPTDAAQRLLLAATHESGTSSWLLMTTACLLWLRKSTSLYQKSLLRAFIQASSVLRNYMVVSGVGLGDFVDYFQFELRKPVSPGLDYKEHSRFHDLLSYSSREFRVADVRPSYFSTAAESILNQQKAKQVHFVYHFTRGFEKNSHENRLYEYTRKNNGKNIRKLQRFLQSVHYADYPITVGSTDEMRIDLRTILRGFDVAGNENQLPIEVFAPALRILRSAIHNSKSPLEKRLRQPFITVHAGEDFSHLLSGLRAVDEAVTFCDYQPNDRIGHGLALGIDVQIWAERQQQIYLPLQEHLDNLVWCYQKGMELIAHYPQFQPTVLMIANKISHFCNQLHGEEFSPRTLYQAWLLRRNCPSQAKSQGEALGSEWLQWVPDAEFIQQNQKKSELGTSSDIYKLWQKYLARPRHDQDYDQVVLLSCQKDTTPRVQESIANKIIDSLSLSEIELIHAIQDLMLEHFSQSQWVIEACPTSNLYIGRLERYEEHPIFRWFPPNREDLLPGGKANRFGIRKGSVRVCINTDDAGLMPTTLENEHRIIKECAINTFGVSDLDACQWIDAIRRIGVELFNSNHLNWGERV